MKTISDLIFELGDPISDGWQSTCSYSDVEKISKEYARQAIEDQLKIAADEASNVYCNCYEPRYDCTGICRDVDKGSIISCTRVELL